MSTSTNTTNSGIPLMDSMTPVTEQTLNLAANVHDLTLQRQLGLLLNANQYVANDAEAMANTVADTIFQRIDQARNAMDRNQLHDLLEPRIRAAIVQVNARRRMDRNRSRSDPNYVAGAVAPRQQYAKAIGEAILSSLNQSVLADVVSYNTLDIDNTAFGADIPPHVAVVDAVPVALLGNFRVRINMNNAFWSRGEPLTDPVAFSNALRALTLDQLGITIENNPLRADQTIPIDMADYLANVARITVRRLNRLPGTPVGPGMPLSLLELQRMNRQQHQLDTVFASGNVVGAALSATLCQQNPGLASVLGIPRTKTEVDRDKASAEARRDLFDIIKKPDELQPTGVTMSWSNAEHIVNNAAAAIATVRGATAFPVPITLGGESYTLPSGQNTDRNAAVSWIEELKKRAQPIQEKFQRIGNQIVVIYDKIKAIAPTSTFSIDALVTPGAPNTANKAAFLPDINILQMLEQIKNSTDLRLGENHQETIAACDKELADIKAGKRTKLSGDAAQHAILVQHLQTEYPNISEEEASQAANYILGRTMMDREARQMARAVANRLTGDRSEGLETVWNGVRNAVRTGGLSLIVKEPRKVISDVASICRLPRARVFGREGGYSYDYENDQVTYDQLLLMYYTLDHACEGKPPIKFRLGNDPIVRDEQSRIVEALVSKGGERLIKDFSAALQLQVDQHKITQEQANALRQNPKKEENASIVHDLLRGGPPASYTAELDRVARRVNKRHGRNARAALATGKVGWKLAKGGAVLGAQYVVAKPARWMGGKVKDAAKGAWARKGPFATFCIATAASGGNPLVGLVTAGAHSMLSSRSKRGGASDHHAAAEGHNAHAA